MRALSVAACRALALTAVAAGLFAYGTPSVSAYGCSKCTFSVCTYDTFQGGFRCVYNGTGCYSIPVTICQG